MQQIPLEGKKLPRVALAGNPNCGKTTLFNALTGLRYKVANYPGVTVEKKEGTFKLLNGTGINVIDLPGIYSLSGNSLDERIATQILLGEMGKKRPCQTSLFQSLMPPTWSETFT